VTKAIVKEKVITEKILKKRLAEQREAIAQEIESRVMWKEAPIQINSVWNQAARRAAEIARGQR